MTSVNRSTGDSLDKNNAHLRLYKAYLRRRLASGPPISPQSFPNPGEKRCSSTGGEDSNAGRESCKAGASSWSHFWPMGRHEQCKELRKGFSPALARRRLSCTPPSPNMVLHRTVIDRESQSALLLGCRGSGKSLVLDRVLRSLAREAELLPGVGRRSKRQRIWTGQGQERGSTTGNPTFEEGGMAGQKGRPPFRAVYLNGTVQTDDGVAMREVVQQLGVTGTLRDGYSSNLEMAVESMKMGAVNGVPVIFVLDEFERFACRKPQTLLYALLDLCQDKTICAAVVGLSINLNVLDVAEKRIKSRFSFQQVRLPPQDFETLCAILEDALTIPEGQNGDSTSPCTAPSPSFSSPAAGAAGAVAAPRLPGVSAAYARRFNAVTRQTLGVVSTSGVSGSVACSGGRVARIRSARADLKALAASGRSIGWFLRLASTAVALLGVSGIGGAAAGGTGAGEPGLTRQALVRAAEMLAPDPHAQALRSLSVTQLLVLVAVARLERRGRKRDGCSFLVIFQEYESYLRKFPKCHLRFSKAIVFKAYRQLAEQGVLRAAESGTGGGREAHPMLHARFRSRFGCDEIHRMMREELVRAPTNVVQWCKEWQREV